VNVSQRVLYNTLAQIAGKAALLLAGLVTLRLATSYLGLHGFGEYATVLALAPILLVFADLGISTLLARELVQSPERREELAGTLLWFRLGASAVVLLGCLALVPFLPYEHHVRVGLLIACAGVSLLSVGSFATPFFQVSLRLDLVALLDCAVAVLTVGLVATVTLLDLGFYALVGVNAAVGLANLVCSSFLVRRFWRPLLRFDRQLARRLVADGLPLAAVIVLGLLHFRFDAVLLSLFRPAEDVGVYTVAYRFLEQSLVLPGVFMAAVFPLLAAAVRGGDAADVVRKAFSFLLLIGAPLALVLVVLAKPLVMLVAGDGFESAALPLRILAPALLFTFVNAVFASVLIAMNRQRALILVSLAGLTLNVLANLYAIPRFGYVGAAVTTVISEAAGLCAVFVLAKRACPFRLSPRLVTKTDVALLLGRQSA
jgi:O-antigen/teichoic acid export membrane protein